MLLGVSSVWNDDKGLSDFIALSRNPDFIVVLVGLNGNQVEMLQRTEYKDCNIIPLERTQKQHELAMLYSMADILISLSYSETFGMTMAEAYVCGTPCIVYDNSAQPEIVTPNTGRVAKTGDIDDVARLVYEMTESNFKVNHSADCRLRAEQMYDKDRSFKKYIDLYNSILSQKL